MRAHAGQLDAVLLQQLLERLSDRGAEVEVLMLDPDLQVARAFVEGRRDQILDRRDRFDRVARRVRPGAHEIGQAAVGQFLSGRDRLPVQAIVALCRVARGGGHWAHIGAGEQIDLVARRQLLDGGDGLLRVGGVTADQLNLTPEQTAGGIDLIDCQFVAAGELEAVFCQRTGKGIDLADLDRIGGQCGHRRQSKYCAGERQGLRQPHCNLPVCFSNR